MTFDDKVGIGLGWQTMSEEDGEILIVNGMWDVNGPILKNGKELKQRKGVPVKILLTLVTHSTYNTSFDYTNRSKV